MSRRPPKGLQPRAVRPGSTDTPTPTTRQHGWLGRRLARGFAAVMLLASLGATLFVAQQGPATAADFACYMTDDTIGTGPELPGSGAEALLAPGPGSTSDKDMAKYRENLGVDAKWSDPDRYTLLELNGVRGTTWSWTEWYQQDDFDEYKGNDEPEKRCSIMAEGQTMAAQMMFDVDRTIAAATIKLRQSSTDATPWLNIVRDTVPNVATMRDTLFIPGVVVAYLCTGIWVLTKWRGDRMREVLSGLLWAVMATISVAFLLSAGPGGDPNYLRVAQSANDVSHDAVEAIGDAILPKNDDGSGPCTLAEDAPNRGTRMLDCSIYQTLVFDPWSQGQYGSLGYHKAIEYETVSNRIHQHELNKADRDDIRIAQVKAQAVSWPEQAGDLDWDYGITSADDADQEAAFDPDTKAGQWNLIRQTMFENHHSDYATWEGVNGSSRLAAAFSGLIASVLVAIFVCATSLVTMVWNAVPVILILALPIVGLFAIYPPLQKYLLGWAQTWIKAVILGFVFAVAQMLSLVAVGGILQATSAIGWKCLLMVVLVMALWKVVQAAREDAFTPNLGGDATIFDGDKNTNDAIRAARTATNATRRVANSKGGRVLSRQVTTATTAAASRAGRVGSLLGAGTIGLAGGAAGGVLGGAVVNARNARKEVKGERQTRARSTAHEKLLQKDLDRVEGTGKAMGRREASARRLWYTGTTGLKETVADTARFRAGRRALRSTTWDGVRKDLRRGAAEGFNSRRGDIPTRTSRTTRPSNGGRAAGRESAPNDAAPVAQPNPKEKARASK